jgi:glycerol-3-phosphate dehydrogenase
MPWLNYTLIGSTDTDYDGDLDAVAADESDVAYLLAGARQVFPEIKEKDVFYATAGLRPLAHIGGEKPSQVTRQHKIIDHATRDGIDGMVTVLGGKITAYRAVAEEAVDVSCRKLRIEAKCTTAQIPLPGATAKTERKSDNANIPAEIREHLADLYGSLSDDVLGRLSANKAGADPVCPHCKDILAQVQYAIEEESALTVGDFLLRRSVSGLAQCQGLDAVENVAKEMGRILGWSIEEQKRQVGTYKTQAQLGQVFREKISTKV